MRVIGSSLLLILVLGTAYLIYQNNVEAINVFIGDTQVRAEVADSTAERVQGLSGRESLSKGRGMLFVFDKPGRHGIWMKDMYFPIDIIWLDADKRVVYIKEDVFPDTYPTVFRPTQDASYVLEVPGEFVMESGLSVGDVAVF